MPSFRSVSLSLLLLSAAAGRATAQTTYEACYVPSVGAIYLIKLAGLPSACLAQSHVPMSWTDGAGAVSDHGGLSGLADDDHLQYLLTNGVRDATDGFAVTGTAGTGTIPVVGNGDRLMWYPAKAALRAGFVFGTEWNDANVGFASVAMGQGVIASGYASAATGRNSRASGNHATALGDNTWASGAASTAVGYLATAAGDSSTAMGARTQATGHISTAMGQGTTASGHASTAMGSSTAASGIFATAMGSGTTASSYGTTAMGLASIASGNWATAMGEGTTAQAYGSLAIGMYNVAAGAPTNVNATDPVLVVGNGSFGSPSDALTLLRDGSLTIAGTLTESSDLRFKEDVETLGPALDGVLRLRPIRYRFRPGTGHPTEPEIGLVAQEVEPVFPELVRRDAQGYLSVAYTDLAAVLVRAVQEQQALIADLRAELAALRETVAGSAHRP
jgi:hypothetical protein